MVVISENFLSLVDLDPVLTDIFFNQYGQIPMRKDVLFGMRPSTKSKETDQRVGSFADPPEFKGILHLQEPDPDYQIEYLHKHYADGFTVDQVTFEDQQYGNIFGDARNLAVAFARKQEKDAAGLLNGAFTGVTGYDGKVLCADDHPQSFTDATAVDNKLTAALTSDSLETANIQLESLGDDRGEETSVMGNLLVVPRALRKTAFELTQSELTPENANTAANLHEGMQFMVWERLTSTTAWFVTDTLVSEQWLKWYDRIASTFGPAMVQPSVMKRLYFARMRYSFGWSDFRWLVGSTGTT